MTTLYKTLSLCAALALSACGTPDHLKGGPGDGYGAGTGNGAYGAGGIVPGSADDPTSPLYFQQVVGDRVLFAVDQSTLSSEGIGTLNGQAQWLMANPEYEVIVEGHADEQGTREYNLALGARRASAVYEYLLSQGIPSNRMRTVSYGKERPIEICSEESCYARNRRAVTVISSGSIS